MKTGAFSSDRISSSTTGLGLEKRADNFRHVVVVTEIEIGNDLEESRVDGQYGHGKTENGSVSLSGSMSVFLSLCLSPSLGHSVTLTLCHSVFL